MATRYSLLAPIQEKLTKLRRKMVGNTAQTSLNCIYTPKKMEIGKSSRSPSTTLNNIPWATQPYRQTAIYSISFQTGPVAMAERTFGIAQNKQMVHGGNL